MAVGVLVLVVIALWLFTGIFDSPTPSNCSKIQGHTLCIKHGKATAS